MVSHMQHLKLCGIQINQEQLGHDINVTGVWSQGIYAREGHMIFKFPPKLTYFLFFRRRDRRECRGRYT